MKKILSLCLAAVMTLGLCACGGRASSSSQDGTQPFPMEDSEYSMQPDEGSANLAVSDVIVAFVADENGVETGPNASAWRGVKDFASNFHFASAQSFVAQNDSEEAALAALRAAAESGASLVVCCGEKMAGALYKLQGNYPTVSYLLLGAEPHSEDYVTYTTNPNVHCVLFQEEQAGYLAGYAAVMEGYTNLGFVGADKLPGTIRYLSGYQLGADTAAELQGVEVALRVWYAGSYHASEEITARMTDWYGSGIQVILASGGTLAQSCVAAAQATGGKVIASGWDQAALGSEVLTSAISCNAVTVQQLLYRFYTGGQEWDAMS
ncbi:MAG: BMP family ABC transporter substrate-binding protein, partial [Gemmiger sp.]